MAKLNFENSIFEDLGFTAFPPLTVNKKGTVARWTDPDTGAEIVFKGKNFVESPSFELLDSGKVKSIEIIDDNGTHVFSISDFSMKAGKLMPALEVGILDLVYAAGAGNDRVVGSNAADYLIGGAGNDVMTGGKGSDYFEFHAQIEGSSTVKAEHDVITDFQWKGRQMDDLQYVGENHTVKKANHGEDTLITFTDTGSTLLLENVTKANFLDWADGL